MKKKIGFFAKALVMLGLVLGFLFGIVMPQYSMGFNASLLDKVDRLTSLEEPKIVLIGNSNLVFGMDSQRVEEAFNMPVVNMGLHGGAGNAFHEEMAKLNVREGDIYIVCHTDYNDNDTIDDPSLVWITIENHFSLWPLLRPKDLPQMKEAFSTYLKKCLDLWIAGTGNESTGDLYARDAFNAYGDDVYPRPEQDRAAEISFESQSVEPVSESCANRLNELNRFFAERGATLLLAAYPIASGEFTPLVSAYEALQAELEEKLDFPVISYFSEYMLDYSYFYDTLFHLTDEGVQMRTSLLIEDIRLWMEQQ